MRGIRLVGSFETLNDVFQFGHSTYVGVSQAQGDLHVAHRRQVALDSPWGQPGLVQVGHEPRQNSLGDGEGLCDLVFGVELHESSASSAVHRLCGPR